MELTKEQELMNNGYYGEVLEKSMKLIIKIAEIYDAEKLVPIASAQIAGVSYLTVGEPIFAFFDKFLNEKIKVRVPSWLNPAGMDLQNWEEMNISQDFAEKQLKVLERYKQLGIETTLTCAPYLIGHIPKYNDHLAWSESSAVVMANSFFGAKTNREGGPSSLAAAITGYTGFYGLHLDHNRVPQVYVNVETSLDSYSDYSSLGYWYGKNFKDKIPLIEGIKEFDIDKAKAISSAMAASGSGALFYVKGFSKTIKGDNKYEEQASFSCSDKKQIYESISSSITNIELVVIGCPHSSEEEILLIHTLLKNKKMKQKINFWIFTARKTLDNVKNKGEIISELNSKGVKVYADTCMVVSPVVLNDYNYIATNSAKAVFYLSRKSKNSKIMFSNIEDILEMVTDANN